MLKNALALAAILYTAASGAAVEVNQATEAELDSIKGIGPSLSSRILEARQKTPFKDWRDFISRTQGVGAGSAARLSREGLTINGEPFKAGVETKK